MTYPYSFLPAGERYQAQLRQQAVDAAVLEATPVGKVARYVLRTRLPEWSLLLTANPAAYGPRSLRVAIAVLEDLDVALPHLSGGERVEAALQLQRFRDTLALKS